jgi:ABC-type cobalamin/Fe3+-siderophores transport system ATPase subunit/SAM-dependent methyltransferase
VKFTEINIPEELAKQKGLRPITMNRLGNVVLIAGQNGSGKTRLLNLIIEQTNKIPRKSNIDYSNTQLNTYKEPLDEEKKHLITLNKQIKKDESEVKTTLEKTKEKEQIKINIKGWEKIIQDNKEILQWDILKVDEYKELYPVVSYVPKKIELDDSAKKNISEISQLAAQSRRFGVDHLSKTALSKIQSVCTRYSNATNAILATSYTKEDKDGAIDDYNKLQEYFKIYLNTEIKINLDGLAEIFGFPIGSAELSEGQKILIQYCVGLFNQEAQLDNHILLLDEPENHLHPEILLKTLDKIVQSNKNGQIWIATHSINVLAHFYEKDIWFMEDGGISFMGREPEHVLTSLLGNEDEIEKLQQFISMPSIFATNHYAFESLKYPLSVITGKSDPQSQQVFDLIKNMKESGKKIKLLDMGAGKGRLLQAMAELSSEENIKLTDWLDYYAFDKYNYDKDECTSLIKSLYEDTTNRYFNDETKITSELVLESFDVIMLVNVLHEISPLCWNDLFAKASAIYSLLAAKGKLIIVEDQVIPNGEKAYTEGFIVFDVPQFKKLFKLKSYDYVEDIDGKLKAHIFNKDSINNFTDNSLKDALSSMFLRAKKEVEDIRDKKTSYKNGMVHGFWVQQLANTFLVMKKMGIKIK